MNPPRANAPSVPAGVKPDGQAALSGIRVVLTRPSHPGNIGAAARAMKTMGITRLYLVAPAHFPDPVADARASGATDVLAAAQVVPTLAQALAGTVYSLALTARRRDLSLPFMLPREGARSLTGHTRQGEVALVFGNEASGLSNDEVALCSQPVSIPVDPAFSSLNLGAAVQLMCYESRLAALDPHAPPAPVAPLADFGETEAFLQHLERAAIASGFHDPLVPRRFMLRMRRLFGRIALEKEEINILRGLLASFEAKDQVK